MKRKNLWNLNWKHIHDTLSESSHLQSFMSHMTSMWWVCVCVYLCLKDIYGYELVLGQVFTFSQFWRLHVWNPGADRVGSFWRFWGGSVPCPSPSFCCLPVILGIPWFVDVAFQSAFIFAWCFLLYLLVSIFLFL